MNVNTDCGFALIKTFDDKGVPLGFDIVAIHDVGDGKTVSVIVSPLRVIGGYEMWATPVTIDPKNIVAMTGNWETLRLVRSALERRTRPSERP